MLKMKDGWASIVAQKRRGNLQGKIASSMKNKIPGCGKGYEKSNKGLKDYIKETSVFAVLRQVLL